MHLRITIKNIFENQFSINNRHGNSIHFCRLLSFICISCISICRPMCGLYGVYRRPWPMASKKQKNKNEIQLTDENNIIANDVWKLQIIITYYSNYECVNCQYTPTHTHRVDSVDSQTSTSCRLNILFLCACVSVYEWIVFIDFRCHRITQQKLCQRQRHEGERVGQAATSDGGWLVGWRFHYW